MNSESIDFSQYSDVHWKAQDSKSDSLLFFRLGASGVDGARNFLKDAKFKHCYINCDFNLEIKDVTCVSTKTWEEIRENSLNYFYPLDQKLKLIGVTGTNGKTTVTDLVRQLCVAHSIPVKTIGTLGVFEDEEKTKDFSLTTPDYVDLRKVLSDFVGVACIEMSSHALDQNRFGSLKLDAAAWTSFSQDHLDYHLSMENYFKAKLKIFDYLKPKARLLIASTQQDLIDRIERGQKLSVEPIKASGSFFKAIYNQENLGLAKGLLKELSFKIQLDKRLSPPPGRFNIFESGDFKVVIDFAHTPAGLESIGRSIREAFPAHQLVTLFGCGGDRDKTKRAPMGEAASQWSSFVILTSDNPRFEDENLIIDDIVPGVSVPFERLVKRDEAIRYAFDKFKDKSVVLLIAGKGHENYIDQKGVKTPYSDEEVVRTFLKED